MIRCEDQDGVRVVTINRPEKRNALTINMLADIAQHANEAKGPVAIVGAGPVFCAGFDLDLCRSTPDGAVMRALLAGLSRAIRLLRDTPTPVVMGVHGAAVAGGCALLGGADLVIASREAKFGYPVTRIGVSPAVSGPFVSEAVGAGAARAMLLDPGLIDAERAHAAGLVGRVVDRAEDVLPAAVAAARAFGALPAACWSQSKRWFTERGVDDAGADRALMASLGLTGGPEERALLGAT